MVIKDNELEHKKIHMFLYPSYIRLVFIPVNFAPTPNDLAYDF